MKRTQEQHDTILKSWNHAKTSLNDLTKKHNLKQKSGPPGRIWIRQDNMSYPKYNQMNVNLKQAKTT